MYEYENHMVVDEDRYLRGPDAVEVTAKVQIITETPEKWRDYELADFGCDDGIYYFTTEVSVYVCLDYGQRCPSDYDVECAVVDALYDVDKDADKDVLDWWA